MIETIYAAAVRVPLRVLAMLQNHADSAVWRLSFMAAAVGVVGTLSGNAHAVKLVVRASPAIEARAFVDGEAFVVRGTLRDDIGAPISNARVDVSVRAPGAPAALTLPPAQPCTATAPGGAGHGVPVANDAYLLETDSAGTFCARSARLPETGVLHVTFAGIGALEAVSLDAPYDVSRAAPSWGWDPRPEEIDLDVPRALATVAISEGSRGSEGAVVTLWDERGTLLATGRTDADGRASLAFATAVLAAPGAGSWEARAGSSRASDPALRAAVSRVARVSLVTAPPAEAIVPADGYVFDVVAESSRGPADGGAVEAVVGDRVVGTGPVRAGRAAVHVAFELKGAGSLPLTFRYLSASPFWRPGPPVTIPLAVKPPSPFRRAPLLLLGLFVLAWIARSWRRAPATARKPVPGSTEPVAEMIAQPVRNAEGFQGTVVDAHGRAPIAGASVAIVVRDFHGERRAAETTTDAQGGFQLAAGNASSATLVVEAALHSRLTRPLPPPGRLTVALIARRRSLLNRLVEAARKAGGQWAEGAEPTPGHIARVGLDAGKRDPAAWALAVESAAFGTGVVDAATEQRVAALETELPAVGPQGSPRDVRR